MTLFMRQKSCQVQESSTDTCSGHVERLMRYTLRNVGVYARHIRSNENARASNSGKFPLSSGDVGRTVSRFEVGVLVFDVDRDLGGCRRTFRSAICVLGLLFWDERSVRVCALGLLWVHTSNNLRWSVARARGRDVARVRVSSRTCHDREVGSWQEGVRPRSGDVVTISNYPQGRTRGGRAHYGRDGIARCSLKSWISSTLTWSVRRRRWSRTSVGQRSRFLFENKKQNVFDSESRSDLNFTGVPPCRRTPR